MTVISLFNQDGVHAHPAACFESGVDRHFQAGILVLLPVHQADSQGIAPRCDPFQGDFLGIDEGFPLAPVGQDSAVRCPFGHRIPFPVQKRDPDRVTAVPLGNVHRAIAPTHIPPGVPDSERAAGAARRLHPFGIEAVATLGHETLHEVELLTEPGAYLVVHAQVHHIHPRLTSGHKLTLTHIFRVTFAVGTGRVGPVAVVGGGNPASLQDDGALEIPFGRKGLFPILIVAIHAKGVNGTFIPSLVGVFKIKINQFKTLLVLVTKNSLVDNVPRNHFSYWQLLRILKGKPQKVSSSQFNSKDSLVRDDPIFERAFQIQSIKENPNYNKIAFKNYNDFQSIINSDLEFFRQVGAKNFDLLLMYYEFENTQKHEKQGQIKIRQTNKGAEFIEESLPQGFLEEEMGTPINKENKGSFDGDFFSMAGNNFLDDDNFGGDNFNMKKVMNTLDINDKSNINGFDGLFDNFNCLCFFTFENVFDIRKRNSVSDSYYNDFKTNVLSNFCEYKK